MRLIYRSCVLGFMLLLIACGDRPSERKGAFDIRLAPPSTVVSMASALLGAPSDIAVDLEGRLWVVDSHNHRLLLIHPDGGTHRFIGREGQGPGEFQRPSRISARDTLLRVIDAGNSRVKDYHVDGRLLREHVVSHTMLGGGALLESDHVVVPTMGFEDALARVVALDQSTSVPIGSAVVPVSMWDISAMKQVIAEGQVPPQLRNTLFLSESDNGGFWLLLQTEGELRKYSPSGDLIWSRLLAVPELAKARQEFFRKNSASDNPGLLYGLTTVVAARELNGRLWILMKSEEESTLAVFYILDTVAGNILGRVSIPVPSAANTFVIDPNKGRLYLGVLGEASVLSADFDGVVY